MDISSKTTRFEDTPLITPERLLRDAETALAVTPLWVHLLRVERPEGHETDPIKFEPGVVIVLGKTRIATKTYSILQAAFLLESTRIPGISMVTNTNGKGRWYERFTIADRPDDLTQVNRVFKGASHYDRTTVAGAIQSDMRVENLSNETADKIAKDTRTVFLGHVERLAKAWAESGRMPPHFTVEEYLQNLHRLLHLIDQEATGKGLSDLILPPAEEA